MAASENKSESNLKIKAYSDGRFTDEKGEFEVKLNPSNLKISTDLNYNFSTGLGSSRNRIRYNASMPRVLQFQLCFDATGAYNGKKDDVNLQVKKLNDFLYDFKNDIKSPYYIRVIWGVIDFMGRLASLDIGYIMFEANGKPLRAEVHITVIESDTKPTASSHDSDTQEYSPYASKGNPSNGTTAEGSSSRSLVNQQSQDTTSSVYANSTDPVSEASYMNDNSSPGSLGEEGGSLGSDSNGLSNNISNGGTNPGPMSFQSNTAADLSATRKFSLTKEIFDDIRHAENWVKSKV